MAAAFFCIGFLVAIPICLLIGAAILRGGISLANACLGPDQHKASRFDDYDYEDDYDRPSRRNRSRSTTSIPEPGLGYAMVIVLVVGIAQFIANMAIAIVVMGGLGAGAGGFGANGRGGGNAEPNFEAMILGNVLNLVSGFVIMSGILTAMLPTTFGRACLATFFYYLIIIAIGVVIFIVVFAAVGGMAGLKR